MFPHELDRDEIDRQFAEMAKDNAYQTFQTEFAESFAESDWEALVLVERVLKNTLDL